MINYLVKWYANFDLAQVTLPKYCAKFSHTVAFPTP